MKSSFFAAAASMLLAPAVDAAANIIDSGSGFGTYYYDLENPTGCSNNFNSMNGGVVECNKAALSLDQINSNNLVAMNHTLLAGNLAKYCGKKVIVSVNGVASSIPFFIGDGCERCGTGSSSNQQWNPSGAPGLDFSFSQLSALNGDACAKGHIDISWQITDETVFNFDSNSADPSAGAASPSTQAASASTEAANPAPQAATLSTQVASPSTEAASASTEAANPAPQPATLSTQVASPSTEAASASTEAANPAPQPATLSTQVASPSTEAANPPTQAANPPANPPSQPAAQPAGAANQSTETGTKCRQGTRARRSAKMRVRNNM